METAPLNAKKVESVAETFRNALGAPLRATLETMPVGEPISLGQAQSLGLDKGISKRSTSQRLPHLVERKAVDITFTADKGKRYTRRQ